MHSQQSSSSSLHSENVLLMDPVLAEEINEVGVCILCMYFVGV